MSLQQDVFQEVTREGRPWPESSTASILWNRVEDACLQALAEKITSLHPKHLSLHFDGVIVDDDVMDQLGDFPRACSDAIFEKTGEPKPRVMQTRCSPKVSLLHHGEDVVVVWWW